MLAEDSIDLPGQRRRKINFKEPWFEIFVYQNIKTKQLYNESQHEINVKINIIKIIRKLDQN